MTPRPGDFGVVRMNGPAGFLIRVGQWMLGEGWRNYEHAFICIGVSANGDARVVQAMPEGADAATWPAGRPVLWSTGRIPLTDLQRAKITQAATGFLGRPYGFLDYLAIAAHRLRLPLPGLRHAIDDDKSLICSQLVCKSYEAAGIDLFPGEWDGYCTPAMLADLILEPKKNGTEGRTR